jgi:divalent metal cation (Fe/Co/Zn/Cd) transporter
MMSYTHLGMVVKSFLGFYGGDTIIFGGAIFQYEGVHKLMEPIAIKNIGWGLAVLGVSMIIEGKTFMIALKQEKLLRIVL